MCLLCVDDAEEGMGDHDDGGIKENFREQDIYLPIANVARIMKNAVPQTGKVSGKKKERSRNTLAGVLLGIFYICLFCITFNKTGNWCIEARNNISQNSSRLFYSFCKAGTLLR